MLVEASMVILGDITFLLEAICKSEFNGKVSLYLG